MKALLRFLAVLIIVAGWTAFFVEHRARIHAAEEIRSLRLHLAAIQEDLAKMRERVNLRDSEVKRLHDATKEIYKLRNQAGLLQDKEKKVEQLLAEIQQLRAAPGNSAANNWIASSRGESAQNSWPKENWSFSGYATPEAALQSLAWAVRDGDRQKFLDSMSPEEKSRQEKEWADDKRSPDELKIDLQNWVKDVSGVKILDKKTISDDEVILAIYTEGEGDVTSFSMKRIGGEWKTGPAKELGNLFKK